MTERLSILLLTSVINLALGLAVWLKNSSQRVNQYFAFFSFAVATWTFSNGLVDAYAATPLGIIWARTAFAAASAIPLSFLLFATVFPASKPAPSKSLMRFWIGAGLAAILASFTPLIAESTTSVNGILQVAYGPLHPFFGAYFIFCLAYSLLLLYRKLHILKGIEKLQVRYVFLGVSLPILGGTVTNLLVPLALRSSKLSPYGPLFSLLLVAVIAHAIIRYRLMNIRLVIRRGVAYLITIVTAGAVFIAILWIASRLLLSRPHELPLWLELATVLLVAIAFQPLKRLVQALVDRYFFREPYDYQRTVREISRTMAGILDLQPLLSYACEVIHRTVQPESIAVFILDVAHPTFRRLILHKGMEVTRLAEQEAIAVSAPIADFLASRKHLLVADELERLHESGQFGDLLQDLRRLHIEVALPILEDSKLAGFFLIGPKLSGDPYFSEDLDLLTTLLSQATIAIKNAQLYSQVVLVNEYVENILTTIESSVIAVSAEGMITLFNSAAERLLGLDARQIKAASFQSLPRPIATLLESTLEDREPRTQIETTISNNSGRVTPVICSTSALRDRAGSMLGAVAVLSDLTLLKQLEAEKSQAERLASIGALASGIAHEVKNPLVAIKTFAELLPERFTEEEFRHDFAKVVIREIERIDDLVARLRGLASAPAQERRPLDLRGPLDETLALLRGQLEQGQIDVKTAYDNDLPLVSADPAQLKQLFLNLLVNALEAMDPRGHLSVRILNWKASESETVLVEISDTGTGIPEPLLGKIFDPFVTTKQRGSGLGLSICRGIADAHGAKIRARNNPNARGATITIEFPVAKTIVALETAFRPS
jgi:PAS domain S-box-containing protein